MPGQSKERLNEYLRDLRGRARDLQSSGAFAPPPSGVGDVLSMEEIKVLTRTDRKRDALRLMVTLLVLLLIAALALHVPFYSQEWSGGTGILHTSQVLACWNYWFQSTVVPVFDHHQNLILGVLHSQLLETVDQDVYNAVIARGAVTAVVVACGFMLAVSGLLFQSTFRNPLATPTMMGVSEGVSLGTIAFVLMGHAFVSESPSTYYLVVYGCGVGALLVVLVLSRVMAGGKNYSVFDMLLVGTVLSQLLGGVVSYITLFGMDLDTWETWYEVQQGIQPMHEPMTYAIVLVLFVVSFIPVFIMRFRLNLISYDDAEVRMLGARPGILRGFALAFGALMQLAALASIGQVAMVSLAVPFLVRYLFRNEFRQQLVGNFLVGAVVLLLCETVQSLVFFTNAAGTVTMPLGSIIAFVIMPIFIWVLALQKRGWE